MLTGIAAHAITEAQQLLRLSLHLHAFFIQALVGSPEPFDAFIHQCKPHPGQVEVARVMRQLLEGSRGLPSIDEMMNPVAGATPRKVIQDRYSIRCLPQYLGPILDGMEQIAKQVAERGLVPPAFYHIVSGCWTMFWWIALFRCSASICWKLGRDASCLFQFGRSRFVPVDIVLPMGNPVPFGIGFALDIW
jgi:hypothetical protein